MKACLHNQSILIFLLFAFLNHFSFAEDKDAIEVKKNWLLLESALSLKTVSQIYLSSYGSGNPLDYFVVDPYYEAGTITIFAKGHKSGPNLVRDPQWTYTWGFGHGFKTVSVGSTLKILCEAEGDKDCFIGANGFSLRGGDIPYKKYSSLEMKTSFSADQMEEVVRALNALNSHFENEKINKAKRMGTKTQFTLKCNMVGHVYGKEEHTLEDTYTFDLNNPKKYFNWASNRWEKIQKVDTYDIVILDEEIKYHTKNGTGSRYERFEIDRTDGTVTKLATVIRPDDSLAFEFSYSGTCQKIEYKSPPENSNLF